MKRTAILIDGGFYNRVAHKVFGDESPKQRADRLEKYCKSHIKARNEKRELYRIFYYDCPPSSKKVFNPLTQKQVDLSKSSMYQWMTEFLSELVSRRKFALRLGTLSDDHTHYNLKYDSFKKICTKKISIDDLSEDDIKLDITQKGVDMKIGIDIASLAYKKQVDQIILISGDCDFVPAAKLARREGIDFILDNMRRPITPELNEHIDGIQTRIPQDHIVVSSAIPME